MFLRRLLKIIKGLIILGFIGAGAFLGLLFREHKTPIELPALTGPFAVGRATYTWVNDAQAEELAPSPGTKRELAVWIWYPAAAAPSAAPSEYLPAPWRAALDQHSSFLMNRVLTRDLSLVHTHSTLDPPVSPPVSTKDTSYPVVIMRAGGAALTTDYTTLAEDLASHGYIVVGFDAPYRTFVLVLPDGRVATRSPANNLDTVSGDAEDRLVNNLLTMWVGDTKFVVNQLEQLNAADPSGKFTGRLDLRRLGMFGHSFGGAQSLQFCHDDSRCKAGIDIDGAAFGSVVREGLTQPFLFVFSDHRRELSDPATKPIQANFESLYAHLPKGDLRIAIHGANHFSFSDQILLKSQYVIRVLRLAGFGDLDSERGLAITTDYVHRFFDVYLKGAPMELLKSASSSYPEVKIESPLP